MADSVQDALDLAEALGTPIVPEAVAQFIQVGPALLAEWGVTPRGQGRDRLKLGLAVRDPGPWIRRYAPSLAPASASMPTGQPGVGLGVTTGVFRYYHAAPVAEGLELARIARDAFPMLVEPMDVLAQACGAWRTAAVGLELREDQIVRAAAYSTVPTPAALSAIIEAADTAPSPEGAASIAAFVDLCSERPGDWPLVWAARSAGGLGTKLYLHLRRRLERPSDAAILARLPLPAELGDARAAFARTRSIEDVVQLVSICIGHSDKPTWTAYLSDA